MFARPFHSLQHPGVRRLLRLGMFFLVLTGLCLFAFAHTSLWAAAVVNSAADVITKLPRTLRETGLYAPGTARMVRDGIAAFSPQYALWSDGAEKRRWLFLPPGTFIDASRPDEWVFPRGTRLWKEFALDGRPVETRYIERLRDGSWRFATYVWNEAGDEAVLAPEQGVAAATTGGRSSSALGSRRSQPRATRPRRSTSLSRRGLPCTASGSRSGDSCSALAPSTGTRVLPWQARQSSREGTA